MTALLFMSEHKNFRVRDYIAICLKTSFRSRDRFFFFFFFFFCLFFVLVFRHGDAKQQRYFSH